MRTRRVAGRRAPKISTMTAIEACSGTAVHGPHELERRITLGRAQGDIYMAGSADAHVIALAFISRDPLIATRVLQVAEARALAAALGELADDLDLPPEREA
jgi:hypothetical protein